MEWLKTNAVIAVFCLLVIGAHGQGAEESVDKKTTSTTAATTTTTAATTTTPATTTPTTAKPTTTTTPKPTPFPRNKGDWTTECVKVQGAMEIAYNGSTLPIPPSSSATSDCSDLAQTLTLTWPAADGADVSPNTLTLSFLGNRNKTEMDGIPPMKYGIVKIDGVVNIGNETIKLNILNLTLFHVGFNHSYKCDAQEVIKDEGEGKDRQVSLKTADWQVEAFRIATGGKKEFGEASDCTLDGVTDVVPIAVGACLAGLVVIVLIAYLFGRRRSRARGYQSV
jgi:lysosomal-associated membrane protein 1/2